MRRELLKITTFVLMTLPVAVGSQVRQPAAILRVIDGESIELRSGVIIRLAGVKIFPNFSPLASPIISYLDSLWAGKNTELEFDSKFLEDYAYWWCDSVLVNVELLRRGWMQVWDDSVQFKYRAVFLNAEDAARQNKSGGWKRAVPVDSATTADDTVYVTKSGKKYHRADCRLLTQNKIALPLSQARVDHEACRSCMNAKASASKILSVQSENKIVPTRCLGKTKNGERCKREAEAGSKFCWQHRR